MTLLYLLLAVLALTGAAAVVSHNRFVRQRNLLEESWRQVDVELHRRHDLVPALVETVAAYAGHERSVVDDVLAARARAVAAGGSRAEQALDEARLDAVLTPLAALAEAYPQLRSDGSYRDLQAQLAETEDRLAAGRRFYNGNVRAWNTRVETFPSSLVAGAMRLSKAEYFQALDPAVRARPGVAGLPGAGRSLEERAPEE